MKIYGLIFLMVAVVLASYGYRRTREGSSLQREVAQTAAESRSASEAYKLAQEPEEKDRAASRLYVARQKLKDAEFAIPDTRTWTYGLAGLLAVVGLVIIVIPSSKMSSMVKSLKGDLKTQTSIQSGTTIDSPPIALPHTSGPPVSAPAASSTGGLIVAGYICGFVALLLLPIPLGITGFVIGIFNLAKGSHGHGIAQMIISLTCGYFGVILGANSYQWAYNHFSH